jgi:uncharacterized membrane protein YkvA (DUF1232 family)
MRTLVIALGVGVLVWTAAIVALVALGRRSSAAELARLLPNLVVLFRGLLRDPRVPRSSKLWLGAAIVWFVSPIDLIPEFIPVAGPLDDAIVAALVLRHIVKRAGPTVVEEHWRGGPGTLRIILRAAGVRPTRPEPQSGPTLPMPGP